jgi:hypothetical protein
VIFSAGGSAIVIDGSKKTFTVGHGPKNRKMTSRRKFLAIYDVLNSDESAEMR